LRCCLNYLSAQIDVYVAEAAVIPATLVQDTDQVDDDVSVQEVPLQAGLVMDICLDEGHQGIDGQGPVALASPGQYTQPVSIGREAVDQMAADEAGTAENADL
jgi:hypothetical protein